MPCPRPSPLRAELDHLLALALALPAVGALAACNAGHDGTPATDASFSEPREDASGKPADGGFDAMCTPFEVDAQAFEDSGCGRFIYLPCGVPVFAGDSNDAAVGPLCNPPIELCTAYCPEEFTYVCQLATVSCANGAVLPDASMYLDCSRCLGNIGRRPRGLRAPRVPSSRSLAGRYLALAAHLEAASVAAFDDVAADLARFGAPPALQRAARRAARDEERHARIVTRLARRHGAVPEAARRARRAPARSLDAFLLHNAVEGCVRETYGALVARHQAARAEDAFVARTVKRLAEDETRHAELAWRIHAWGLGHLPPGGRVNLRKAQGKALEELARDAGSWPHEVTCPLGLPASSVEPRLVAAFASALGRIQRVASRSPEDFSGNSGASTS